MDSYIIFITNDNLEYLEELGSLPITATETEIEIVQGLKFTHYIEDGIRKN